MSNEYFLIISVALSSDFCMITIKINKSIYSHLFIL